MTETNLVNFPLTNLTGIDSLLWDWNGTLLDDVTVNLSVINDMLSRRSLRQLSLTTYKEEFCFPVQSFHRKIGFDFEKESIEEISAEYHATYKLYENGINLNADTPFVLDSLNNKGINQFILSASMKNDLMKMLDDFHLTNRFKGIYAADDICATGKIEIGKQLIRNHSLNSDRMLIVGDTLHDAEVAKSLGINYILYIIFRRSQQL